MPKKNKTGGTSGKGGVASRYLNPKFDPRIQSIGVPTYNGGPLTRGRIVAEDTGEAIRFLYNPISIQVDHTVDPNNPGSALRQRTDPSSGTVQDGTYVGLGSTGVDLLYDRTYECWDSHLQNTWAGRLGMYADVLAFYEFLGVTQKTGTTTTQVGPKDFGLVSNEVVTETWQSLYPVSFLNPDKRCYLYIGDTLKYFGYIDSLSITYSHFTHKMIPVRGAISVSLQLLTTPDDAVGANIKRHKQVVGKHRTTTAAGGPASNNPKISPNHGK